MRLRYINWASVATIVFMIAAVTAACTTAHTLAVVLGMCSIAWAVLSTIPGDNDTRRPTETS